MTDPVTFARGANQLNSFLHSLRSNFNFHGHLFPRSGPNKVKYALSLQDGASNHQNPILREMVKTDHPDRAGTLSVESDPSVQDFNFVSEEMDKVYGDKDR